MCNNLKNDEDIMFERMSVIMDNVTSKLEYLYKHKEDFFEFNGVLGNCIEGVLEDYRHEKEDLNNFCDTLINRINLLEFECERLRYKLKDK